MFWYQVLASNEHKFFEKFLSFILLFFRKHLFDCTRMLNIMTSTSTYYLVLKDFYYSFEMEMVAYLQLQYIYFYLSSFLYFYIIYINFTNCYYYYYTLLCLLNFRFVCSYFNSSV